MQNPFLLTRKEQLAEWKSFRESLPNIPENDQIAQVKKYWSQAPVKKLSYDPQAPDTWPGPWEMIHDGDWSADTVAIGMEFTLRLSGWDPNRLALVYVREDGEVRLLLEIDENRRIGYHYDEPANTGQIITKCRFEKNKYRWF